MSVSQQRTLSAVKTNLTLDCISKSIAISFREATSGADHHGAARPGVLHEGGKAKSDLGTGWGRDFNNNGAVPQDQAGLAAATSSAQ